MRSDNHWSLLFLIRAESQLGKGHLSRQQLLQQLHFRSARAAVMIRGCKVEAYPLELTANVSLFLLLPCL
jgi:hypothetical protein